MEDDVLFSGKEPETRENEIEQMFDILQKTQKEERIFQKLPFAMRRRSMSHNPFKIPKNIRLNVLKDMSKNFPKIAKRINKAKRKKLNLVEEYKRRNEKNKRLDTHLFHAKRFKMISIWGYRLSLKRCEKSERKILRFAKRNCVLHDRSYMEIISITGEVEDLRIAFEVIFLNYNLIFQKVYMSGEMRGVTHLKNKNELTSNNCPVSYIWLPNDGINGTNYTLNDISRTIWLFVHPSLKDEVWERVSREDNLELKKVEDINIFELFGPDSQLFIDNLTEGTDFVCCYLDLKCVEFGSKKSFFDYKCKKQKENTKHLFKVRRKKDCQKMVTRLLESYSEKNNEGTKVENSKTELVEVKDEEEKEKHEEIKNEMKKVEGEMIPLLIIRRNKPFGVDILVHKDSSNRLFELLTKCGCLCLGLDERRRLLNNHDVACFPDDYPESEVGLLYYKDYFEDESRKYFAKPAAKRVNYLYLGTDYPFSLPFNTENQSLNSKELNQIVSKYTLLTLLSSGWYHSPDYSDGNNVIRMTNFPSMPSNKYLLKLLTSLKNNTLKKELSSIKEEYYVSVKISGFKGNIKFLSRIYQILICDFSTETLIGLLTSKYILKEMYNYRLKENVHEEFKLKSLKKTLEIKSKNDMCDGEEIMNKLSELNEKGILNSRKLIGFVTSKGLLSSGIGCVKLRDLFGTLYSVLSVINDDKIIKNLNLETLKIPVWFRNRDSTEYYLGIISFLIQDVLIGIY